MLRCAKPLGRPLQNDREGMPGFLTTQVNVFNFIISSVYLLYARRGD